MQVPPDIFTEATSEETLRRLLDVSKIYMEPTVPNYPRGREILAHFPEAERIEVPSHWKIPGLFGNEGEIENWIHNKRTTLVLGAKKSMAFRPNTRSSDFVAPSHANGCAMACAYCYVPRRKGYANPISTFVNIEQIQQAIRRHSSKLPAGRETSQIDPEFWVYEIGENSDVSVDALISRNVSDLVELFAELPNAKATFATKFVNRWMLNYPANRKTRIRFSLMPSRISRIVDVRTSSIPERISAINDFVEAGYEVHVNFAPVIFYEGWLGDYEALMIELDDVLSETAKNQLAAEVIFLTHNDKLHEVNLSWHPKAESYLWAPEVQEPKFSQTGGKNVRYKTGFKGKLVDRFCDLLKQQMPYCRIRYAF